MSWFQLHDGGLHGRRQGRKHEAIHMDIQDGQDQDGGRAGRPPRSGQPSPPHAPFAIPVFFRGEIFRMNSPREIAKSTKGAETEKEFSRKGAKIAKFRSRKEKGHHPLRWRHGGHGEKTGRGPAKSDLTGRFVRWRRRRKRFHAKAQSPQSSGKTQPSGPPCQLAWQEAEACFTRGAPAPGGRARRGDRRQRPGGRVTPLSRSLCSFVVNHSG